MDRNPNRRVGLIHSEASRVSEGYTLFWPYGSRTAYLIDIEGQLVHHWDIPYTPGLWAQLLDNGNLLCAGNMGQGPAGMAGGMGGAVLELDWDGNVVWVYEDPNLHHDVSRAPNGNTFVLGWEPVRQDLASDVRGGIPGSEPDEHLWCDYINEVTPEGKIEWGWHAQDALDVNEDVICGLHPRHEWTHANACTVLPDGNVLTSFRVTNTLAIVDRTTKRFAWKYSNVELGHQHDPTLLDNGNVLVFANGMHVPNNPNSRLFEIDIKKDEIVWRYESKPLWEFFSGFISGAQRLPNSNTLVCEGMTGRLFEITLDGQVVWEYVVPFFADHPRHGYVNSCFRTRRYAPDHPAFIGKRLVPQR